MRSASEHPWTYQNRWRISLAGFSRLAPQEPPLRVHALIPNCAETGGVRSIIRAVRNLGDWMVEQAGFELATPRSGLFGELSTTLAWYLAERKAAVLERISSP